jgi:hypothetical protein
MQGRLTNQQLAWVKELGGTAADRLIASRCAVVPSRSRAAARFVSPRRRPVRFLVPHLASAAQIYILLWSGASGAFVLLASPEPRYVGLRPPARAPP